MVQAIIAARSGAAEAAAPSSTTPREQGIREMRKLKLGLESLHVESFEVLTAEPVRGTVLGLSYPNGCHTPPDSLDADTCQYATCAGTTCWYSCNGTCD